MDHRTRVLAGVLATILSVPALTAAAAPAHHSAAECRAACQARNIPASCDWMSPVPARCQRDALRGCMTLPGTSPVACPPPKDLPACTANHTCPNGALCVNLTCQVVACTDCPVNTRCTGDRCAVDDC